MPQDAFTLKYLCEELNGVFKNGKVNRITQPNGDQVVFTIYTGKKTEKLMISVNPSCPRMGIVEKEEDSPLTAPNFCMLLRKHLLSATIIDISLIGFDRIVKIDLESNAEFSDSVVKTLYVELMGRYSNIILTENGKILGGNRGINMFDNGVRPLIVGKPYVFPPVNDKKLPQDTALIAIFDKKDIESLAITVFKNVQGVALETARELVSKYAFNNSNIVDGETFYNFLNKFLFKAHKKPCVISDGKAIKDVCVFPYQTVQGVVKTFEYLYQAEEFYFAEKESKKRFTSKKERLTSIINTAIKKAKKRLTAINSKERDALDLEVNRLKGELILANVYKLKQGDSKCRLLNYYNGEEVEIALDVNLTPAKNAENYYKKYNKQKRTITALTPQKEQATAELNYFVSLLSELELCEDILEVKLIEEEMAQMGLVQQVAIKNKKVEKESFCNVYEIDGFVVRAGRNNTENDKLTFTSKPHDIWLHAKDYHSSHVVIETNGREISEKVILISSKICAYYSKGRDGGKVEVVWTQKKNVKKPPKSKPGFCTYDNFKSITVEPNRCVEFIKSN